MLFIIIYKCNTNKLVIFWINECYQISYKLYNKQHTYFFTQGTQYFLVKCDYSCNYFNLFIRYICVISINIEYNIRVHKTIVHFRTSLYPKI